MKEKIKMRATGIIRRVDDLGRIVIPREIRRVLKISEGCSLEFFTDNNAICLKKYQPYETETWEKANKILSPLLKNFAILDGYGDAVKCNGIKVKDHEEAQNREDLIVKEYCQHGDRLAYLVCSKSNEEIRINLAGEVLLKFLEEDE